MDSGLLKIKNKNILQNKSTNKYLYSISIFHLYLITNTCSEGSLQMTCDTAYITNNSSLYNISIDDFDASDVPIRQEECHKTRPLTKIKTLNIIA